MTASESRTRRLVLPLAIAVIAVVPILPALHGGWLYDDRPLIVANPYVHQLHWFTRWFTTDFWDVTARFGRAGTHTGYWRPLVTASYALDWQVGTTPTVFHVTNLLLEAATAALAFVALRRWIGATWPAFVAAVLFALHPTKAESVAWISGRTDILCALGLLLASEGVARRLAGRRGAIALEIAGTLVAYLSKEQGVVLPVFVVIEAWVALGRPPIDVACVKRLLRTALPQLGVAVAYLAGRAVLLPIGDAYAIPLPAHVAAVLETFGRFIALTFAPRGLSLQPAIVHMQHHAMVHAWGYVALGGGAVAGLVALAFALRRRLPIATVGIGCYLALLLPTSNLKYTGLLSLVSDRFLYLPVLGLALVAAGLVAAADAEWRRRGIAIAGACAVAMAAMTASRAQDFSNEDALWMRELAMHPDNEQARMFLLTKALDDRRFSHALEILGDMEQVEGHYDPDADTELTIASNAVFALAQLTPDHDQASLHAIDRFVGQLLDRRAPIARLDVRGVQLAIAVTPKMYVKTLDSYRPELLGYRADIASRLGDNAAALRYASASRALCSLCAPGIVADALVHARAGRYDAALAIVDTAADPNAQIVGVRDEIEKARRAAQTARMATGPAQLDARAQELAALGLWGRAYDTLAPYEEQLLAVPRLARAFAELAFRAGEPKVAREVLQAVVPPAEIEPSLEAWAEAMGWADDAQPPASRSNTSQ